jgi:hypothetical protein
MMDDQTKPLTQDQQRADARLLDTPIARALSAFQLERIVRLLLMTHSRTERRIIGLIDYHGMNATDAGELLELPAGRVSELYQSIHIRESDASNLNAAGARRIALDNKRKHTNLTRRSKK